MVRKRNLYGFGSPAAKRLLGALALCLLALAWTPVFAGSSDAEPATGAPETAKEQASKAAGASVQEGVKDETAEKRKEITEEASAALRETQDALKALEEGKTKEALAAMERATGKLEVILAREPELALAPIDVSTTAYDVLVDAESIERMADAAEELLEEGRVQGARALLENLRSEYVISVTNLPMASYPRAIKDAVRHVDNDEIEKAKATLATALNTLVVTDTIVPRPIARAEVLLEDAEALAEKSDRTKAENEELATLLDSAQAEIEKAESLGYGSSDNLDRFFAQLDQIREKTVGGKSGEGFFDTINRTIASLFGDTQSGESEDEAQAKKGDQSSEDEKTEDADAG